MFRFTAGQGVPAHKRHRAAQRCVCRMSDSEFAGALPADVSIRQPRGALDDGAIIDARRQ